MSNAPEHLRLIRFQITLRNAIVAANRARIAQICGVQRDMNHHAAVGKYFLDMASHLLRPTWNTERAMLDLIKLDLMLVRSPLVA